MSLTKLGQLERGALRVGAMSYRIVVLPRVERIEPALMKRLRTFARAGGVLIAVGRLPERAPGFLATPADHQAVRALSSALFEGPQPAAHFVRDAGDLAATISRLVSRRRQPDTGDARHRCRPSAGRRHRHLLRCEHVERASRCRRAIPDATEWRGVVGPRARHDDYAGGGVTRRRPHPLAASGALRVRLRRLLERDNSGDCPPCSLGGQSPFGCRPSR